jgi:hypothetical protein
MVSITYKKRRRYKYTLSEDYSHPTIIRPTKAISTSHLLLDTEGLLTIKKGYAWDGPSGPTIDTKTFMRGSLVHDALYQLMREQHISRTYREYADRLLRQICVQAGMSNIHAWIVYWCVRIFGGASAKSNLRHAP